MGRSDCNDYFGLDSVVESSNVFGHGRRPYRVLKEWYYPASHTYKVRILGNDSEIVFIKLLGNGNEGEISKHQMLIENEYNVLKLLRQKCDSSEYGVLEPLECIKSKLALITRGEEGKRLDKLLLNIRPFSSVDRSQIVRAIGAAGKWLRNLFESTKLLENDCDVNKGILDEIDMGLTIIRRYKTSSEWVLWERTLRRHISRLVNSIDGSILKKSLCHGDFIPANILLSRSGRIVVLDLTDSGMGMIYNDLATHWQWLDDLGRRRPWCKENQIEELKICLLKGFFHDEVPSALVSMFLIKTGIGRIYRMVEKESGGTLLADLVQQRWVGNLMRERRVDYWKRRLLMIAESGWRLDREA